MVKQDESRPQDWLRILFEVQVPGLSERKKTMAGRNFKLDLNPRSDLRNWLAGLLGQEFFREHSGQQVSLHSLIGTDCIVELVHFQGDGYEKPHVVVASVHPANPAPVEGGKD